MPGTDPLILWTGPSARGVHRLDLFMKCPRRFALSYPQESTVVGAPTLARDGTDATNIGTLIHLWLAHYYKRKQLRDEGKDPEVYYPPEEAVRIYASAAQQERYLRVVNATMRAYEDFYRNDYFTVAEVEEEHRIYINNKWLLTGRMDLVVQDGRGYYWIWDHKSTQRHGSQLVKKYSVSLQFLAYQLMGREKYGPKFAGMRANFIQYGDSLADLKFVRENVSTVPARYEALRRAVDWIETQIEALRHESDGRLDVWPALGGGDSCYSYGRPCPALSLCDWGA